MAKKIHTICLPESERVKLTEIVNNNQETERSRLRARILLASDVNSEESSCTVLELAEKLSTTHATVQSTRSAYAENGLEAAVFRKKRTVTADKRKLNVEVREQILKLQDETPPYSKKEWSLRLLCEEAVRRGIVDKISPASMMKLLKESDK